MSYQEQGGGSDSVVVNGTVEGVEIKPNGRFVVKVREIGSTSQYALNLNTKEQNLAQQMMQSIGQSFSFICGLSHWTNQAGQPVTSKWINGVAPLQQPQPQSQPQPQGWSGAQPPPQGWPQQQPDFQQQTPTMPFTPQQAPAPAPVATEERPTDDPYIRRVSWLAAVPAAVAALEYLPEEQRDVAALVKMTDFLAQTAIIRGQRGFNSGGNPGPNLGPPTMGDHDDAARVAGAYGDPGPEAGDPGVSYGSVAANSDDDIPF